MDDQLQPATGTEDLGTLLEGRRREPRSPLTTVLLALVLVALGAVGGLLVGRSMGSDGDTQALGPNFDGQPPNGASGAIGFPGGGNATVGTIEAVNGSSLVVRTLTGETVTVDVGSDTEIRVTKDGTLGDLAAGDTVVVAGNKRGDSIDASSIAEGGLGGPPAGTVTTP